MGVLVSREGRTGAAEETAQFGGRNRRCVEVRRGRPSIALRPRCWAWATVEHLRGQAADLARRPPEPSESSSLGRRATSGPNQPSGDVSHPFKEAASKTRSPKDDGRDGTVGGRVAPLVPSPPRFDKSATAS